MACPKNSTFGLICSKQQNHCGLSKSLLGRKKKVSFTLFYFQQLGIIMFAEALFALECGGVPNKASQRFFNAAAFV